MKEYKMTADVLINPRTNNPFTVVHDDSLISIFSNVTYKTRYGIITLIQALFMDWFFIIKNFPVNINKPYAEIMRWIEESTSLMAGIQSRTSNFIMFYIAIEMLYNHLLGEFYNSIYFQSLQRVYQNNALKDLYLHKSNQLFVDLTTDNLGLSIVLPIEQISGKDNRMIKESILLERIRSEQHIAGTNMLGALHRQLAMDIETRIIGTEPPFPFQR